MERSKRANRGQNYARWAAAAQLEDEKPVKKQKIEEPDEEYEEDSVRCTCGATRYDETDPREMVECEKCLSWQHIVCVTNGGGESALPEPYVCPVCARASASVPAASAPVSASAPAPAPAPAPTGDLPPDKVRQSVISALDSVFSTQLIPMAQREGLLAADLDAAAYAHELAREIELAIFSAHAVHGTRKSDVGAKYREKFRTLSFNLKNDKNHLLQTQIITRTVSPEALAVLGADEMLSPELRKLADQVKQESIQGSILKVDEGPRVRKTHKGEEIVEQEDQSAPASRDPTPEEVEEPSAPTPPHPTEQPRVVEAQYDTHFEEPEFSPHSPRYSDAEDDDFEATMAAPAPVWKGRLALKDLAGIEAEAVHLASSTPEWAPSDWPRVLTGAADLRGRVPASVAEPYIERMAALRIVAAVAFTSTDTEGYETLFNHYHTREKYGAIASCALAKDAYLIPLPAAAQLPPCLASADASGDLDELRKDHPNLLLGLFVLAKKEA